MKWTKEIKHKLITLLITLTVTATSTAGLVFSCSGEIKKNGEEAETYTNLTDTIEKNTSVSGL